MAPLDAIDAWPVGHAAAAVVGPDGLVAGHGDLQRGFALASVTKPLAARAGQVAVEEGALALDTEAGPPGATIRHLLAHASGLTMHSDQVLAAPGTRRIYSNYGFAVFAEAVAQATEIEFAHYLHEAICVPLGMSATRLDGGAAAAGYGATSTVADLAAFATDLLRPATVSAPMHADATTVQYPGLDGVLPGFGCNAPTTGGWGSRSRAPRRRTGPVPPTRRAPSGTSASPAPSSGWIRSWTWRWWCSPIGTSVTGRTGCGRSSPTR